MIVAGALAAPCAGVAPTSTLTAFSSDPQRIDAAWSNPPNAFAVRYALLVFVVLLFSTSWRSPT